MFQLIDSLISKHGFALESWNDRYGKGVWVTLSPAEYLTGDILAASSDGDCDMIPATEFILSTQWMPVVTGRTFLESLGLLEGRLATLPQEMLVRRSSWSDAVCEALQHLRDVRRDHPGYGKSAGRFVALPENLSDVLKLARQAT